jgi:hypothetical protein
MRSRDVALPGLVLLLGLFIGIYLLAPLISPALMARAPPLYIALLYYAGLPILAVAGASFSFTWYRGRAKDDHHRTEILEVLSTPVSSAGEVEYNGNSSGEAIVQRPLSWTESNPLYPYTLAHLENYADTLALLDSARKYSDEQRGKIVEKIQTAEQLIDQKLSAFTALPALTASPEKSKPHYITHLVRYAILTNSKALQEESTPAELKIQKPDTGKRGNNQLLYGSETIAVGSAANLKKLSTTIRKLAAIPEVKQATSEIQESQALLKANPFLTDFEAKRTQIAFALSAGQHQLPGHCERCP